MELIYNTTELLRITDRNIKITFYSRLAYKPYMIYLSYGIRN